MAVRLKRKPKGTYHHPDLESALVDAAVKTIREEGMEALTLRGVGARLGVSRTALYRHFDDKAALLARVALDGFRRFHQALAESVIKARSQNLSPLEEMGVAYVAFALANESHYLTMFGRTFGDLSNYPELVTEGDAAFNVLVTTIREEQQAGRVAPCDPQMMAQALWASSHGQAMLAIHDQLDRTHFEAQARFFWHLISPQAR